jgi:hypothetical protein
MYDVIYEAESALCNINNHLMQLVKIMWTGTFEFQRNDELNNFLFPY